MSEAHNKDTCEITLASVTYSVEGTCLVDSLDFNSTEHRIGIVGRNGSGKSTFARLLCGLLVPTEGLVTVAGVDVANDRVNAIRTVGMLFQNADQQIIFPTVEEELVFGLQQLGNSREQASDIAMHALQDYKCEHWKEKSVSTLSQGQRHLLCLLSVLVMKPRLIVLDEPYAGLDIPTSVQLRRHLDSIDATVVHISHQPDTLMDYERVVWLDKGKIVLDGPAKSTLAEFETSMQSLGENDVLL